MLQKKPYNGLHEKELNQINQQDGSPCVAISAPGCFIKGSNLFSEKRAGNRVRFFTTGRDYFSDLASALEVTLATAGRITSACTWRRNRSPAARERSPRKCRSPRRECR